MICAGCRRELEVGDLYIVDTASGFLDTEATPEIDGLIADIFGGDDTLSGAAGGKVVFCEDCTDKTKDGRYLFDTVYGDED